MPCHDGGYEPRGRVEYRDNPETKERLDRATRILCEVLKQMTHKEITLQSDELQVWWAKHQIEDRKRELAAAEATQRKVDAARVKREEDVKIEAALSKLTDEDKEALGLIEDM